jgi:hypothetical protein
MLTGPPYSSPSSLTAALPLTLATSPRILLLSVALVPSPAVRSMSLSDSLADHVMTTESDASDERRH